MDIGPEGGRMVTISASDPNPSYGREPDRRSIKELLEKGLVIIDKPRGPTSHQVAAWVKDILGIEKAGHHGTLDPNTTGVLPIALGSGVRMLESGLSEGKEYIAIMRLHSDQSDERIRGIASDFTGEIYQFVPVRSAVKRGLRTRRVHYLKVLEKRGRDVLLLVGCESGTYVRTLIHDMGEVLGVGANMSELRRTRSGRMSEESSCTLQQLRDALEIYRTDGDETAIRRVLMPYELLVSHLPPIVIKDSAVDAVCHGAPLGVPGVCSFRDDIKEGQTLAIYTLKGEVVAIGKAMMDAPRMSSVRNGGAALVERVIMEPGTYPRQWKSRTRA